MNAPRTHPPAIAARRRARRPCGSARWCWLVCALAVLGCDDPDRPLPTTHTGGDDVATPIDAAGNQLDASDTGRSTGAGCAADQDCVTILGPIPACTTPRCVSSACVLGKALDGAPCDDGSPCTDKTTCLGGSCIKGVVVPCDDDNPCTHDSCALPGGCTHTANHAPCGGTGCELGVCDGGVCSGQARFGVDQFPGRAIRALVPTAEGWVVAAQVAAASPAEPAATSARWLRVGPGGAAFLDLPLALTEVEAAAVAADTEVVFAGSDVRADGTTDGALVRVRLDGTQRWRRSYDRSAKDRLTAVAMLPDSTAAACGTAAVGSHTDAWYIRASVPTGYPLLDFTYGSSDDERCHGVVRLSGGDLLLVGDQSAGVGAQALALRVTDKAKLVWNKSWGAAGLDAAYAVVARPDGAAWVAGVCSDKLGDPPGGCLWLVGPKGDLLVAHKVTQGGLGGTANWAALELRALALQGATGIVAAGRARPNVGAPWRPVALWRDAFANPVAARFVSTSAGELRAVAVDAAGAVALAGQVTATQAPPLDRHGLLVRDTAWGLPCDAAASCSAQGASACDDGDPCTADWCAASCGHNPLPEGSTCALGLTCQSGACAATP